jgi:AmmeMemoRadiSam system protein A
VNALPADAGAVLLATARTAIDAALGAAGAAAASRSGRHAAGWLAEPGACFVSLYTGGRLRGCVGTLAPWRPLVEDVSDNAVAAALRDRRFPPLTASGCDGLAIEVSLLSAQETLAAGDDDALLALVRPGVDGLVFEYGHHRGTLLPQVWESLPEPRRFLDELKRKAGLPPDFWEPGTRVARYTVTRYADPRR